MEELRELSLPDSLEMIDELNLEDCDNLRYNELDGAKYLGNENNPYIVLVKAEDEIEELNVKSGCKIIFSHACANNTKLKKVFIPESVRYIGFMAFYECKSLSGLTLSEGVTLIDSCAFDGCVNLKIFKAKDGSNLYGDYIFSECTALEEVILPKALKSRISIDEFENSEGVQLKFI